MNFFNVFISVKEGLGGGSLMHVYVWEHIAFLGHRSQRLQWPIVIMRCPASVRPLDYLHFRLLLQNRLMDFDETWYGWSTQVPYKCCCFSARSVQGRIQGGAKIGPGGSLLQRTSSSDQKATATNRMHSSDLETCGKKCGYFWFHSKF